MSNGRVVFFVELMLDGIFGVGSVFLFFDGFFDFKFVFGNYDYKGCYIEFVSDLIRLKWWWGSILSLGSDVGIMMG